MKIVKIIIFIIVVIKIFFKCFEKHSFKTNVLIMKVNLSSDVLLENIDYDKAFLQCSYPSFPLQTGNMRRESSLPPSTIMENLLKNN